MQEQNIADIHTYRYNFFYGHFWTVCCSKRQTMSKISDSEQCIDKSLILLIQIRFSFLILSLTYAPSVEKIICQKIVPLK